MYEFSHSSKAACELAAEIGIRDFIDRFVMMHVFEPPPVEVDQ